MTKILILTGDAGESLEIYYAKHRLEEEEWRVVIASPERRTIQSVVHDFEAGFDTYTEKPGYLVRVDLSTDEVDPSEFEGLVIPGGRAPEYLRNKPEVVEIVKHFLRDNKPIAANCHGPLLLIAAGGIEGKTLTCYPDLKPDIEMAGGRFVDQEVSVDGAVVCVRGWPDNSHWMREFVKQLRSRIAYQSYARSNQSQSG